jgi:hypothetical protein
MQKRSAMTTTASGATPLATVRRTTPESTSGQFLGCCLECSLLMGRPLFTTFPWLSTLLVHIPSSCIASAFNCIHSPGIGFFQRCVGGIVSCLMTSVRNLKNKYIVGTRRYLCQTKVHVPAKPSQCACVCIIIPVLTFHCTHSPSYRVEGVSIDGLMQSNRDCTVDQPKVKGISPYGCVWIGILLYHTTLQHSTKLWLSIVTTAKDMRMEFLKMGG